MSFATDGGVVAADGGVETLNVSMNAVGKVGIFLQVNSVVLPLCEHGLAGALLDRITHHVHILEMNADSYRLKQSRSRRQRPSE